MFGVIPFKIDADVSSAVPVRLHQVVVADQLLEVQGVLFVDILDPKVVNNKGKGDGEIFLEIQTRSIFGREVLPSSGQDFIQLLVGKFTRLLEALHGSTNFNVDEPVGGNFGSKAVVLADVRQEIGIGDAHVFEPV